MTNFEAPILNINGMPFKGESDSQPLRIGDVCCNALLASLPGDEVMEGEDKLNAFNLAAKIRGGNIDAPFETQTISSKNKMLILDRVAKAYSITVYARVHEALEGTTESVD